MKKFLYLMFFVMLTGCFAPSNRQPNFYYIKPITQAEQPVIQLSKTLNIGVQRFEIPPYLDRPQIVTLQSNSTEMTVSEWNRWSENLSTMLQRTVSEDLSVYLPKAFVKPYLSSLENFDYTILVEINKLDAHYNNAKSGEVFLDVYWSVFDQDNNQVFQKRSNLSQLLTGGYENLADQISVLMNQLSYQMAQEIQKLGRKK